MSQTTASRNVVVTNRAGLHARAATLIAKTARQYQANVAIIKSPQRVESTDVLQLLSLGAEVGVQLLLEASGQEAEDALDALVQLFADKFGEEE